MHSFPCSVQASLGSWPFCPYPISRCIFSKPSKACSAAQTEVFLCCCCVRVKEESFENGQIGNCSEINERGFKKQELFSQKSDQSEMIVSRNTVSADNATPAP